MLSLEKAYDIAKATEPVASLYGARETTAGWYFPLNTEAVGSNGVIVSKRNGRVLRLGSASSIERDIALYDKGYQSELYDLAVTSVLRNDATVETLLELGMQVVTPTFESGSVWRVPRDMTRDEVCDRLAVLPCVFGAISLYFVAEHLEAARERGDFTFEVLPYRSR